MTLNTSFNSTLVQLKVFSTFIAVMNLIRFNSTLVQLKGNIHMNTDVNLLSFNSTLVQLKVFQVCLVFHIQK